MEVELVLSILKKHSCLPLNCAGLAWALGAVTLIPLRLTDSVTWGVLENPGVTEVQRGSLGSPVSCFRYDVQRSPEAP